VLRRLICLLISFQLFYGCNSQESAPVSKAPRRTFETINIEGALSLVSQLVMPTSHASEVTLYSLERGGERVVLDQTRLSANNRFKFNIEKNRVKNKVIMLEVLNSPLGPRSIRTIGYNLVSSRGNTTADF
jgi:hypothetical protein